MRTHVNDADGHTSGLWLHHKSYPGWAFTWYHALQLCTHMYSTLAAHQATTEYGVSLTLLASSWRSTQLIMVVHWVIFCVTVETVVSRLPGGPGSSRRRWRAGGSRCPETASWRHGWCFGHHLLCVCVCSCFDGQLQYVEYCHLDNFEWSRLFEKSLQTGLIHDISFFLCKYCIYTVHSSLGFKFKLQT